MLDDLSDRDLADRVTSSGDEAAFRALYRRHAPCLYRLALRLAGGDTADAEDLTQEAWLRAARGLGNFRWDSAFRTWLFGIAINRYREFLRRDGRRVLVAAGDDDEPGRAVEPGQRIDLERALQLLAPGFRAVLVLHDVEGFTHREIGERLGISDGTCKSQLHNARRAMRRLLNPNPGTA